MLLTVDIGNTSMVMGIFGGAQLITSWRIGSDSRKTEDEYAIVLHNLFQLHHEETAKVTGAIISSVVPQLTLVMNKAIERVFGLTAEVLDHQTPIPMRNLYEYPGEVGVDRLANAVGGKMLYGAPLIVVDFGTATTLDVITPEGDYAGGIILAGLEMSADGLYRRTSRLPQIPIVKPARVLGTNTVSSMQSGLFYGSVAAIDGLIERLWRELGYETKVVATGGLASLFFHESRYISVCEPFLTLYGLKSIWEQQSGTGRSG
jgi:type III pantothenate kinase